MMHPKNHDEMKYIADRGFRCQGHWPERKNISSLPSEYGHYVDGQCEDCGHIGNMLVRGRYFLRPFATWNYPSRTYIHVLVGDVDCGCRHINGKDWPLGEVHIGLVRLKRPKSYSDADCHKAHMSPEIEEVIE
jgi:hypothetical protein